MGEACSLKASEAESLLYALLLIFIIRICDYCQGKGRHGFPEWTRLQKYQLFSILRLGSVFFPGDPAFTCIRVGIEFRYVGFDVNQRRFV